MKYVNKIIIIHYKRCKYRNCNKLELLIQFNKIFLKKLNILKNCKITNLQLILKIAKLYDLQNVFQQPLLDIIPPFYCNLKLTLDVR